MLNNSTRRRPSHRALIIVDVQLDFCEGGSLAVTGGNDVATGIAERLRTHADQYDLIVATRDWHDPESSNAGHIAGFDTSAGLEPDYQTLWPAHCVARTQGANFHPAIMTQMSKITLVVSKGMGEAAYSGFQGIFSDGKDSASLDSILKQHTIVSLDIVGIATDHCVKATALDAVSLDYQTRVLLDLCAGVNPDTTREAIEAMRAAGVIIDEGPTIPRLG